MSNEPTITAPFTERDVGVRDFDHVAWALAQPAYIHRLWSGVEAPASRHAEARIIWSTEALTARFQSAQTEPPVLNSVPQLTQKTIGLWERDVCELFVSPDVTQPNRYLEFEVAPTGEWLDLAIELVDGVRHTDWEFHSGMEAAARITTDEVTIAMRIPWSRFIPKPQARDVWRVNFFRCIGLGNERYLAWQPTGTPVPNFHVPEAFGRLKFV
jgi:hypothetical protein